MFGFFKWLRLLLERIFLDVNSSLEDLALAGVGQQGNVSFNLLKEEIKIDPRTHQTSPLYSMMVGGGGVDPVRANANTSRRVMQTSYPDLIDVFLKPIEENPKLGIPEEAKREFVKKFGDAGNFYARINTYNGGGMDDESEERFEKAQEGEIFSIKDRSSGDGIKFRQKRLGTIIGYNISIHPIEANVRRGFHVSSEEIEQQGNLYEALEERLELIPVKVKEAVKQSVAERISERISNWQERREAARRTRASQRSSAQATVEEESVPVVEGSERQPFYVSWLDSARTLNKNISEKIKWQERKEALGEYVTNATTGTGKFMRRNRNTLIAGALTGLIGLGIGYGMGNSGKSNLGVGAGNKELVAAMQMYQQENENLSATVQEQQQQIKDLETRLETTPTPLQETPEEGPTKPETETKEIYEHTVERGDRLWSIAEALGVDDVRGFIDGLVDYQIEHSDDEAFKQRIDKDTIYVKNGKVRYGENVDGIRGDNIDLGDVIVIPQELVDQYSGDFDEVEGLGENIKKEKPRRVRHRRGARETQTSTSKIPYVQRVIGLALPWEDRPFGVWEPGIIDEKERYYEELTGLDIKRVPYSTPFSTSLPRYLGEKEIKDGIKAREGEKNTTEELDSSVGVKYIEARLTSKLNIGREEAYGLFNNLNPDRQREFQREFYRDLKDAEREAISLRKEGKSVDEVVEDISYAWVDRNFVGSVYKSQSSNHN